MNYLHGMRININCPELGLKGKWMDVRLAWPNMEETGQAIHINFPSEWGEHILDFVQTNGYFDNPCRYTCHGFVTTEVGDGSYTEKKWHRACMMVFFPRRKEDSFVPLEQEDGIRDQ